MKKLTILDWLEFIHLYINLDKDSDNFKGLITEASSNDWYKSILLINALKNINKEKYDIAIKIYFSININQFNCNEMLFFNILGTEYLTELSKSYSEIKSYINHLDRFKIPFINDNSFIFKKKTYLASEIYDYVEFYTSNDANIVPVL